MKKLMKLILFLLLGFTALCIGLFGYGFYEANRLNESAPISSLVYRAFNNPDFVYDDEIPEFLKEATVAVEDDGFYKHPGVEPISLFRGLLSQFIPFAATSGGSTITQQVVKNLYQKYNAGWNWKLTEIAMAFKLEALLDKKEILELYVNIINYGDGHIGIREASEGYFNCEPIQLNEAECSLVAGIPQSPTNLQLSDHSQAAKAKQEVVLKAMVRNAMITPEQMDVIYATPIDYQVQSQWFVLEGQ